MSTTNCQINFAIYRVCDLKIPLHQSADARLAITGRVGNRRHVARGKRVFTGDKFKDSVSATRTAVPQGARQTTPAATRSVGAVPRGGCREARQK